MIVFGILKKKQAAGLARRQQRSREMAARRNKRKRRNRGRFGFLYKVLSAAVIVAAIVAGCAVFFRVENIEVNGQSAYTADQIISAAEVEGTISLPSISSR